MPLTAIFLYYVKYKYNRELRKDFASSALFSKIAPQLSLGRKSLKDGLLLVTLILVVIALADPQVGTRLEEIKREGIDLVVAVDVSKSMLAQDIAPSFVFGHADFGYPGVGQRIHVRGHFDLLVPDFKHETLVFIGLNFFLPVFQDFFVQAVQFEFHFFVQGFQLLL